MKKIITALLLAVLLVAVLYPPWRTERRDKDYRVRSAVIQMAWIFDPPTRNSSVYTSYETVIAWDILALEIAGIAVIGAAVWLFGRKSGNKSGNTGNDVSNP